MNYKPGFNLIDATIVQDGKRFVIFLKDEKSRFAVYSLQYL